MRELVYLWYYLTVIQRQIAPYWILGVLIGSLVSVFAKDKIHGALTALTGKKL